MEALLESSSNPAGLLEREYKLTEEIVRVRTCQSPAKRRPPNALVPRTIASASLTSTPPIPLFLFLVPSRTMRKTTSCGTTAARWRSGPGPRPCRES